LGFDALEKRALEQGWRILVRPEHEPPNEWESLYEQPATRRLLAMANDAGLTTLGELSDTIGLLLGDD
jgi:hypothetical protein